MALTTDEEPADLVITGGRLIDGTGNPAFAGSILIRDGRIRLVRGEVDGLGATRRVDASGHVVAPGFIDIHSHSGIALLDGGDHAPKVRQGVTTEVVGVDGLSYAPILEAQRRREFVLSNAGIDGEPLSIDDAWSSVDGYLSSFDGRTPVNVAMVVGNSALRLSTIGWAAEEALPSQVATMRSLLRDSMEQGAFGVSTGLDYPPGAYATTDEIVALCEEAAALGGFYHTHVRYQLGDRLLDPWREAIEIARRSGVPLHLTHVFRRAVAPAGGTQVLELFDAARQEGIELTFDTFPYAWKSSRVAILLPIQYQEGGPLRLLERLQDSALRPELEAALDERVAYYAGADGWSRIRINNFARPENQAYEGLPAASIAAIRNVPPSTAICDLLVEEDLRLNEATPGGIDEATLPHYLTHPAAMVGSDAVLLGAMPTPRTYGTYPRILGEFVRDEGYLTLEDAVRRMTSLPAGRLGLRDRGVLRDGTAADLVIFDPASVRSLATAEAPRTYPEGIRDVLVGGEFVLRDGETTAARPGRGLRRGQD